MPIEPGQQLLHYRLIEKIGEGGMGVVWKAQDTRLHRDVALKFLPDEAAQSPQRVERHVREARAASAMNHPHICSIYDIGELDGTQFIVMELLEGQSLQEKIGRTPLQIDTAVDLAIQISDALDAAHAKGIIHRDIKTANIFVTDRGQAKVLDFGLAKLESGPADEPAPGDESKTALEMTTPGTVMGTISYMSPEQALGKDLDQRTDIFSLGVVLYEMITAQRAFAGNTSAAMFDAILNRAPTAPVELNRKVPSELQRIVNKALEKDPELRYQSASGLMADLKGLKRDSTIGVGAGPAHAARRPGSSRKWWPAAVALIAVAFTLWATRPWESRSKLTSIGTERITFSGGPEYTGSLSPNSEFIVYAHTEFGTMDLFVQSRVGGRKLRLTEGSGDEILPRWSRDGTQIAYLGGGDGTADIFTISPLGGSSSKLVGTRIPSIHSFWDTMEAMGSWPWSLNDESLLFSRRMDSGEVAIFEVDVETRDERQLTFPTLGVHDLSASWSFDGEWIVFSRTHGGASALWMLPTHGGESRPLLVDKFVNMEPSFLPDDQHVVFTSNRASGMENIWGIEISSGELTQLTFGGGKDWYPSPSRDGTIAYTRWSHQTDLHTVNVSTGATELLTSWTQDNFVGRYKPGGGKVAYQSTRTGNSEIWIVDLETGAELNLSNHTSMDLLPAWSPDGQEIVFVSDRAGSMNLWVAKADGSGPSELLSEQALQIPSRVWAVSLSIRFTPDGTSVGYVVPDVEGPSLWLVDRDDGESARPLFPGVERFDWYLDRSRIVYTTLTEDGVELRAANLETNEDRLLYSGPHSEMILAPDGTAIALVKSESHFNQALFRLQLELPTTPDGLPTAVGEPERLTDGEGRWHVHNGGWSHDGEWIVYTQDTDNGDIYLLTLGE